MEPNIPRINMNTDLLCIAGVPKAAMEAAIARGQGKSATGAVLDALTIEAVMPPSVAMIIDVETDNRNRSMMDLKLLVKNHGGMMSSTSYLFQKKGRITFERDERDLSVDEVLDEAIEAGAEDIELDADGNILVWTEPNKTTAAATALQKAMDLKAQSIDIIWDANEDTKVQMESKGAANRLMVFIDQLQDNPNVQGIYANVAQGALADEVWENLRDRLDA
jgi:transcriptional/translational regulatory protein YebC/TACO1